MRGVLVGLSLLMAAVRPAAAGVCLDWAARIAPLFEVPPTLLQAIVLAESGDHPFALNIDGRSYFPSSAAEAAAVLATTAGGARADIGCAQVSMRFHARFFEGVANGPFDPPSNLAYAAWLLKNHHRRHGSWAVAVAHYHSATPELQLGYVCRVMDQLARLTGREGGCGQAGR